MGGWFSSADNEQTSSTKQEVEIKGNNNVVTLHEEHAQVLRDIRITLFSMAGMLTLVAIIFVVYFIYKKCKINRMKSEQKRIEILRSQILTKLPSMDVLNVV